MKKQLLIATGLAVLSTSAFATTTRLDSLGQDSSRGSYFIDDNYNVFRNAATVNMYKNYLVTEWGDENGTSNDQLQGGFFREMGAFSYGVYLNRESSGIEGIAQGNANVTGHTAIVSEGATTGNLYTDARNGFDLFFGGDMGLQWGARLHYSSSKNGISASEAKASVAANTAAYETEHSALGLGLGVMMGDLSAYANLDLKNEYTGAYDDDAGEGTATDKDNKLEGDLGLNIGLTYKLGDMSIFAEYDKWGVEETNAADTTVKEAVEQSMITVGVGHTHEVSSSARVYSQVSFRTMTATSSIKNSANALKDEETKTTQLPVTIGFEADANSWLTLRGSITQNLPFLGKSEFTDADDTILADDKVDNEDTNTASTTFAAGGTLNFGKLKIDGVIGNGGSSDQLNTDTLFSKVAVHYWF